MRSRIVGEGEEPPDQLLANPLNWRRHPYAQQKALEGMLREVGWVQRVIVNRTTGHVVDGHLRVELAMRRNEPAVPVIYVELTPEEEKIVLAAIDPIGGLAETDQVMLDSLLQGVSAEDDQLAEFLETLRSKTEDDKEQQEVAKNNLRTMFLIPPFSVLDARQGYWQDRKRQWMALGIDSGNGRRDDLLTPGMKQLAAYQAEKNGGTTTLTGTSVFDPVLCEVAYRWFAPQGARVLDPFAGGSVRGIVAAMLGHDYVGIDLRPEQVSANIAQWRALGDQITLINTPVKAPTWHQADSRTIDAMDLGEDFDLVFSCPPYADLEVYSDDPLDLSNLAYAGFRETYREIIAKACARLKNDRFAVFVVGEVRDTKRAGAYYDFVGDTIDAFRAAGLDYYNEAVLVTSVGTLSMRAAGYMLASRKVGKSHQNVLIFKKGQPDLGVDILGLAESITAAFEHERQTIEQHLKVLVFSKGDPFAAAREFGPPEMQTDLAVMLLESGALEDSAETIADDPAAKYGTVLR